MKFKSKNLKSLPSTTASKIIVVTTEARLKTKAWSKILGKFEERVTKVFARLPEPLKAGSNVKVCGIERNDPDILISLLPDETSTFSLLNFARSQLKASLCSHVKELALVFLEPKFESALADTFGAAIATQIFEMPAYGKRLEKKKPFKLENVEIFSAKTQEKNAVYGFETGNGANLVRYLGTLPPNLLNTETYGKRISDIAKKYKFGFKFYSNKELKKMGAGAFTAVDQGNPNSKGGIYEITYSPRTSKNKKHIALVGKGLCFDTGGYDIKTNGFMLTMKGDMQGSALALANLVTASELKMPLKIKAYLGVTENHISPEAFTADQVVTALNGMSIEVINTDAEGRMVLSDTLTLASRGKPDTIIDFATLTGGAVYSIGTMYSAGFTNRDELHDKIKEAGVESGERVWTFPLGKDYAKRLESPIADILQCSKARGIDHILAAYFLSQFVDKDIPWVHIDLSCAENDNGLAHVDSMFTGFGVRWTMQYLKNKYKV
ncbi:MAG: leucyl aminopeptidase family protein [Deltaproteobacteria bacterium]|nr:leucyl aminopeptidase family protein [Deltaproteobacteria bacterium]